MRALSVWLLLTAAAWADTTTVRAPALVQQIGDISWLHADVRRPRVALVLSGGAARGFAQLGVLRAWEESGAPIDLIVGTSIGGTLGGLYAAGYSADSLTRIVRSTDWGKLLSNTPSRRSLFLSYRHQREKAIIELQFDGLKPRLPRGVSSGQKLSLFLADLTRSVDYRIEGDFDRLRIPLRVVATDLVTGERVVIGSGNLRDALRSTVAIPLAFTPWETEGRLLVDGGLLDPIPVDVARELGADIVVAVNTTSPLLPREDLTDPLTLANQATTVMVLKRQEEQLARADLVITPQLAGIGNADFQEVDTLIARGYAAAKVDLASFAAQLGFPGAPPDSARRWRIVASEGNPDFTVDPLAWVTADDLRQTLARTVAAGDLQRADVKVISFSDSARLVWQLDPLPVVHQIEVIGNTLLSTDSLRNRLADLRGRPIRGPELEAAVADIERLYGNAGYDLVTADDVTLTEDGTLRVAIDEAHVIRLTVSGNKRTHTDFILAHMPELVGRPLASDDLDRGISSVYASGLFESVTARTVHSASGPQVELRVEEQAFTRLQLGLHWHEQFHGEVFAELADINVAGRGHKIAGLAQYGERGQKYAGAMSADRLFSTLLTYKFNLYHTREQWSLYELTEELPQSLLFHRTGGTLSFGHQIQSFGLLQAGLRVEDIDDYLEPDPNSTRWYLRTIRVEAELDTYDRYPIPTDGYYQRLYLERADKFLGGNVQFTKFAAQVEGVIPLGHRHATLLSLHAGTADTYLPEPERFVMGGQHSFVGLRFGEMRGDHYWKGGLALRLHNGGRRYITVQYNVGNMWPNAARIDLLDVIHGIGAAYTLNSPAGPLALGIGIATGRPLIGYVNLGLMW